MASVRSFVLCAIACYSILSCTRIGADEYYNSRYRKAESIEREVEQITKSSKCPPEMVEVEGEYCPNVEETCLEWDPDTKNVNGLVRCLKFAPSKCLSKKRQHLHFCMDKFEYQRDKSDPLPTVMVSFIDMQALAKKEDKRLCYDYEWTFACMGEEMRPYPTGWTREPEKCNIDKPWIAFDEQKLANPKTRDDEVRRISQRVPVNANPQCISPFGIYNMSGNVDELLINTNPSVNHKNTLKGGHWAKGARNRCTPRTDKHDESFAFYEVGGRLCKDIE
jgi:formylglycine-generating enzyme